MKTPISFRITNLLLVAFLSVSVAQAAGDSSTPDLPISKSAGWGPCIDVVVMRDRLYAIGKGKLHTADITDASNPNKLGELSGLGNTRQMVVSDGVAYVASREDGLFIVDVMNLNPTRLSAFGEFIPHNSMTRFHNPTRKRGTAA